MLELCVEEQPFEALEAVLMSRAHTVGQEGQFSLWELFQFELLCEPG